MPLLIQIWSYYRIKIGMLSCYRVEGQSKDACIIKLALLGNLTSKNDVYTLSISNINASDIQIKPFKMQVNASF